MAHCKRCNKFMFKSSISGYCDDCKFIVWKEAQEKEEAERKRQIERVMQENEKRANERQKIWLEEQRRKEAERKKKEEQRKKEYEDSIIDIQKITCPKCGSHTFDAKAVKDRLFICLSKRSTVMADRTYEYYCNTVVSAYCKGCNKDYPEKGFGQHGDVWECKECGRVCWPLTERKKKWEEGDKAFKEYLANASEKLSQLQAEIEADRRRYR